MCQCSMQSRVYVYFFFFNDTATTEIYTLSLHDALPISWGWTWVDYSPWGFSPYHYGRWNYFGGRWGWCPGPVFGYPVYGPAFVGFFAGGFGFGVGWFPLGFGEPFFPWFRCRHDFVERINVRNTFIRNRNVFNTNIRNVNFVNARNVNAVTVA